MKYVKLTQNNWVPIWDAAAEAGLSRQQKRPQNAYNDTLG